MREKYATFQGRASINEYWYFVIYVCIISFILLLLRTIVTICTTETGALSIAMLVIIFINACWLICPSIAVSVRRLHDIGRSGWWLCILVIPYIGTIVMFIFSALNSEKQDNKYGPYNPIV